MADFACHQELEMLLGECPVWHHTEQALYWIDIRGPALHRLEPRQQAHTVSALDESIGCIALHRDGGFIAGMRSGIWHLSADGDKLAGLIDNPENTRDHRFNDGGLDPAGRLWLGTMDEAETTPDGNLYRFDGRDLAVVKPGIAISNGLAFSPDGQWLYHTDTPSRVIDRHAFDVERGTIGPAEPWIDLADFDIEGNPDGAAVDRDGYYWSALYGGAAVACFDPDGGLAGHYPVPAPNPTMPAFGDADRCTLYVTTARQGMDAEALERWPQAGSLFAMRVAVPGPALGVFEPDTPL